jgi:hypothetical protein
MRVFLSPILASASTNLGLLRSTPAAPIGLLLVVDRRRSGSADSCLVRRQRRSVVSGERREPWSGDLFAGR